MKKPSKIASLDSKEFSKLLEALPEQPHKVIVQKIDSKMFPLDNNLLFAYKPEYLAFQEFSRCLSLFKQRNHKVGIDKIFTRYAGIQKLIIKEELPHRKKLNQLAVDTIKEIYQVPSYLNLSSNINPNLSLDTEQPKDPTPFLELSLEDKNKMRDEIRKREILNSLVHGSSMHVWTGLHHLVSTELDAMSENLRPLYDQYTCCLGLLIWYINPTNFQEAIEENVQLTQGYNQLQFDTDQGFGGSIEAKGINFVTALHELNKGVLDWLISRGIPQNYSEQELEYFYAISDKYSNEPYHYMLGATLWADLLQAAQLDNHLIPVLIMKLTSMSYQELTSLFKLVIDDKQKAREQIKTWNL